MAVYQYAGQPPGRLKPSPDVQYLIGLPTIRLLAAFKVSSQILFEARSQAYGPFHTHRRPMEKLAVMASKRTVNVDNLKSLGAKRLAELLVELGRSDPDLKRRLRLEVAGEVGGDVIAGDIKKRLTALSRARSFIDWQKRRAFVKDIDLQRQMIVEKVTPTKPDLALDLMWRFMKLTGPTIERVDDSYGDVGDVFRQACRDLGTITAKASPEPIAFADRVFEAVTTNDYGEYDQLVKVVFPALGQVGGDYLRDKLTAALNKRPVTGDGFDYEAGALRRALRDLADGEGDVDAYIALENALSRQSPKVAAAIAHRLLVAGRAEEAVIALKHGAPDGERHVTLEWEEAWIKALLATDQRDEAQSFRWAGFEDRLSVHLLRDYLKALPDFEDVVAEQKALDHALEYPCFGTALFFFSEWKNHAYTARLVLERSHEIDGNDYFILDPTAKTIEGKHPFAAALLRRAMIEDTLCGAKSRRYRHAARHMLECQALMSSIDDYGHFETHVDFVKRLRTQHARKSGFWGRVAELN